MTKCITKLINLNKSSLTVSDPQEDIRGRRVLDRHGIDIGKVSDLYVDEKDRKVRFIEISSGGFLGFGQRKALVPVDAIISVQATEITADESGDNIGRSPKYNPHVVDDDYIARLYEYYGYPAYWEIGYTYPIFPYYPPPPPSRRSRPAA